MDEKILQRKLYWKNKNVPQNEYDEKKANNVNKYARKLMKNLWGNIPHFHRNHKMSKSGPTLHKKVINLLHKEELIGNRKTKN